MGSFIDTLLGDKMPPHGHCYLWNDRLVFLHVFSDSVIALSYFSIPVALILLVHKRDDLNFNAIFVLFAVFIFACGATHLMSVYNVWHGAYWLSGGLKAVTAIASLATAIVVWPFLPRLQAIPGYGQIDELHSRLRDETERRAFQKQKINRLADHVRELQARLDEDDYSAAQKLADSILLETEKLTRL